MDKDEIEIRAREAQLLLDNPMLKEAFEMSREAIVTAIEDNPLTDDATRDKLFISLQMLRSVKDTLMAHVESGKMLHIKMEEY